MVKPDFAALEQASEWYAELSGAAADTASQQAFTAWLDASPQHRAAWQYVQAVSSQFAPLRGAGQQAAAGVLLQNRADSSRRKFLKVSVIAGCGLSLSWLAARYSPLASALPPLTADYRSAVGEIKTVTLADNSTLWLDTDSAVDVRYSPAAREVSLLRGSILIQTVADARPFTVVSAQGTLRALGTRFSVGQETASTLLTVWQHRVEVTPREAETHRILSAGQSLRFNAAGEGEVVSTRQSGPGWDQGILQADNMPLGELVRALARYRRGHLACDPQVAELRVVGTFPLGDSDRALEMLSGSLPVRIRQRFPWWTTVTAQ